MSLEIFEDPIWQMSRGERAAIEGMLASLRPSLAVEIGSMEGACLRRIARHSQEVHSFDLTPPALEQPANVTLHTGDSHELLPSFLQTLAEYDRNVDFVIVDGDHTPEGVRQDLEQLLDSRAVARTVILIHDTANERVRQGIEDVRFAAWPKVAHVELDWIPGRVFAEPALRNELWYGLGLIIVDAGQRAYLTGSPYEQRYHPAAPLLAHARDLVEEREQAPQGVDSAAEALRDRVHNLYLELAAAHRRQAELEVARQRQEEAVRQRQAELTTQGYQLDAARRALENITGSASWRMTGPLRAAKRQAGRVKD